MFLRRIIGSARLASFTSKKLEIVSFWKSQARAAPSRNQARPGKNFSHQCTNHFPHLCMSHMVPLSHLATHHDLLASLHQEMRPLKTRKAFGLSKINTTLCDTIMLKMSCSEWDVKRVKLLLQLADLRRQSRGDALSKVRPKRYTLLPLTPKYTFRQHFYQPKQITTRLSVHPVVPLKYILVQTQDSTAIESHVCMCVETPVIKHEYTVSHPLEVVWIFCGFSNRLLGWFSSYLLPEPVFAM